jgi:hypothetical protein
MTTTDNVARLDDAMAERNQPAPINLADLRKEVQTRRDQVLDRLAVVRIANVDREAMADAMLNEMHAFDRMMQGR